MSLPIDSILEKLGGIDAAARLTSVSTEAIRKWRQAGSVPSRHWPAVIAATGLAMGDLQAEGAAPPEGEDTPPPGATAALVLADGSVFWGEGFGAQTSAGAENQAELCFNTGLTGYQETLTDPSYAGQIITFTFPHIGNTGINDEDREAVKIAARGLVIKAGIAEPANWRSLQKLDVWLKGQGVTGIAGIDTRALTIRIRDGGAPNAVLCFPEDGKFDISALRARAQNWPGLEGMDLAREVTCAKSYDWTEGLWHYPGGFAAQNAPKFHVVAIDFGIKRNILRSLVASGCRVTVMPATSTGDEILALKPDGVFLSNGPGDPAATGVYAVPVIQKLMASKTPIFGICLGHQLLALALGAGTYKMPRGHRGANQPVQDLTTGKVEITSQNHGFAVDEESLPANVRVTHTSLFDGSNEGIACTEKKVFSVQYHPEASPGPSDSHYLFARFVKLMEGAA
jgi:carbamoyl-phosphate synthase small subunit